MALLLDLANAITSAPALYIYKNSYLVELECWNNFPPV